jgi:hypothetical protein
MPDPCEKASTEIESHPEPFHGPVKSQIPHIPQRGGGRNIFDFAEECFTIHKQTCCLQIVYPLGKESADALEKAIDWSVEREFIPNAAHPIKSVPVSAHLFD